MSAFLKKSLRAGSKIIILAFALYLTLCLLAFLGQERLLFRATSAVLPQSWSPSIDYQYEELRIPAITGNAQLYALKFVSPKNLGTVLYFHGNAYSMDVWQRAALPYLERGFNVVMPTYRGFSKSNGEFTNQEEVLTDAQTWYQLIAPTTTNLIVAGRSMGTGVATYLAASFPVDRLLLETPYDNLTSVASQIFPFSLLPLNLINKYPMDAKNWIHKVPVPIYVIHGTIDGTIRPERVTELLASAPVALMKWVPGANHMNYTASLIYTEWLNAALDSKDPDISGLELVYRPKKKINFKAAHAQPIKIEELAHPN